MHRYIESTIDKRGKPLWVCFYLTVENINRNLSYYFITSITSNMKKKFLFLVLLFFCGRIFANVTLPKIFGDNMVLQRNKQIPVWGWAEANEKITLHLTLRTKS